MANAIITFKMMPSSPEVDCEALAAKGEEIVKASGAKGDTKHEIKPLAFGLQEVMILGMFEVSDDLDSDAIATKLAELDQVQSAEVLKMDLAMG